MKQSALKLTALTAVTAAVFPVLHGTAQVAGDYDQMLRELNILENIFAAAMEEDANVRNRFWGEQHLDTLYLAGQGVVITFNLRNVRNNRNFSITNRPGVITLDRTDHRLAEMESRLEKLDAQLRDRITSLFPGIEAERFTRTGTRGDRGISVVSVNTSSAPPAPSASMDGNSYFYQYFFAGDDEIARQMVGEIQDQQQGLSQLQREMRELEVSLRKQRGDAGEIQNELDNLETEYNRQLAELEARRDAYDEYIMGQEQIRRDEIIAQNTEFSTMIVDTLCDYGRTLRSLDSNEHVTVVLQDYLEDTDQLYVFDYDNVINCDSSEALMQSAVSYQF